MTTIKTVVVVLIVVVETECRSGDHKFSGAAVVAVALSTRARAGSNER